MSLTHISVRGAREHKLKGVDVDLPRDALIVIPGLSGSGKSSLAFDTIYAAGPRRYVESLSAYARQFLEKIGRPHVLTCAYNAYLVSRLLTATQHTCKIT